jgi:elongator complex protein 3
MTAANDNTTANYGLAVSAIVRELTNAYDTSSTLNLTVVKNRISRHYKLRGTPKVADIFQALPLQYRQSPIIAQFLQTKPVRTASGVAVVAVMAKPHRCPHLQYTGAVCVYCPVRYVQLFACVDGRTIFMFIWMVTDG